MPRARPKTATRLAPYSRVFGNQFIGNVAIDGRTVEGRFARHLARELTEHLGPPLSVVQKLMVRQIVTMQLQMIVLNQKQALDPDSWTDHDRRCLNALSNQLSAASQTSLTTLPCGHVAGDRNSGRDFWWAAVSAMLCPGTLGT